MLTREEVSQIIMLVRRAPLQNMAEAEVAAQLMARLARECPPESTDAVQVSEVIPIDRAAKAERKTKKLNGDHPHT